MTEGKFTALWNKVSSLFKRETKEGKTGYKLNTDVSQLTGEAKSNYDLFAKYSGKAAYDESVTINESTGSGVTKSTEIKSVKFAFVNEDAKKYGSIDSATGVITTNADIKESDLANGKAVVGVKMTVEDDWGMKMTKTFEVTITKK